MQRDAQSEDDEVKLLLTCCQGALPPPQVERITALVRSGLSWDRLLQLARANRVVPWLYTRLTSICPADVPVRVLEQLRQEAHAISLQNLRLTGELIRVVGKLDAAGIKAMPFKGPALACLTYRSIAPRTCNDLDLILRKEDFPGAKTVLVDEGYRVRPPFDQTPFDALWKSEYNACNFDHPDKGITLDLHWAITNDYFAFPFDLDPFWERAAPVTISGRTLFTLCPEDYLLALCAHGYTHSWKKLAWICDLAGLIRSTDNLDWTQVLTAARACRGERTLFLGLRLAVDLLRVELPEHVRLKVEADSTAKELAAQVRGWLSHPGGGFQAGLQKRLFLLRARECWRDRFHLLRHVVLTPNQRDRAFLPLPPACGFLYHFIRPVRLLFKGLARLFQ